MKKAHPMQAVVMRDGVARFKANPIVEDLLNEGAINLNMIAAMAANGRYTRDDQMQLAQLIGYSVSGYGDLSYASRKSIRKADARVEDMLRDYPTDPTLKE